MILIVNDDETLTGMLRVSLEKLGYTVENAIDGVKAFEHLKNPRCRLMLLEMNLPKINGAELLILMGSEGINVPVIVMGKLADLTEKEMKQFPDVVAFVKRPFHMPDLLDKVKKYAKKEGKPKNK